MEKLVWLVAAALAVGGCDGATGLGDAGGGAQGGGAQGGGGDAPGSTDAGGVGGLTDAGGSTSGVGTSDASGGATDTGKGGVADASGGSGDAGGGGGKDTGGGGSKDAGGGGGKDAGGGGPKDAGGGVDTGTPGGDPAALIITELMIDPVASPDTTGEWIELYNTGSKPVNLVGLAVSNGKTAGVIGGAAAVWVDPGDFVVLGPSVTPEQNGGAAVDVVFSSLGLTNGGTTVILQSGGEEIDRVDYAPGATHPNAKGASLQLASDAFDGVANNDPKAWCLSTTSFGAGDKGTPGAPNVPCGSVDPPPQGDPSKLVITEILYDPTAVADGDGEWVELYNGGSSAVDLRGLTLADSGGSKLIEGPSPLLVQPGGYGLLGKTTDMAKNGGVPVLWAYGFGLNNDKDSVILTKDGAEIDRVDYDEGTGWPTAAGASIQLDGSLDPLSADNGLAKSWCLSFDASPSGDKGTPGLANGLCPGDGGPKGCSGHCGGQGEPGTCWCDDECITNGDCCDDACSLCDVCEVKTGACTGWCGSQAPSGCYCDSECSAFGDCCPDLCATCGICN